MRYITMLNEIEILASKYQTPLNDILGLWNNSTTRLMEQYKEEKLIIPKNTTPFDYCREQSLDIIKRYYSLKQERES